MLQIRKEGIIFFRKLRERNESDKIKHVGVKIALQMDENHNILWDHCLDLFKWLEKQSSL